MIPFFCKRLRFDPWVKSIYIFMNIPDVKNLCCITFDEILNWYFSDLYFIILVEQLNVEPVNSYDEINNKINEGTKNRTVASTNMNATSR